MTARLSIALLFAVTAARAAALELELPLLCTPGEACFVQNYVDTDPSNAVADFTCGAATYDGHKGTDIRVPSMAEMLAGVPVVAAAPGRIKALRDGMADRIVDDESRAQVADRECGNGVVIDHGGGWETQYCHMRRGSIQVLEGDRVEAGDPLGLVGNSGMSQFPHLHLSVRRNGKVIDPYTGREPDGTCNGATAEGLWSQEAAAALGLPRSEVIMTGFAPRPLSTAAAVARTTPLPDLAADWPAIVFFAVTSNLEAGDVQEIVFQTPDGRATANAAEPTDRAKAQYVLYGGRRRPEGGWPKGTYRGRYRLIRDGRVVIERELTAELR